MPTSLVTNAVNTVTPGVYSEVDTSGLAQAGLGASGIVAIIGAGVGGKPYTAIQTNADYVRLTSTDQVPKAFAGGDLKDACNMAFQPSNDPNIPGGAQQIIAMQVNPATAAQATLSNAAGAVMSIVAQRFGAAGNMVSVLVGAGSIQGRFVVITNGTATESKDNLGGNTVANVSYAGQGHGWTSVLLSRDAAGDLNGAGTASIVGLTPASGLTQPSTAANLIIANQAADVGKVLTLRGVDNNGAAVKEVLTLQPNSLTTQNKFAKLLNAWLSVPATSAVTITAQALVYTIAAAAQGFGALDGKSFFVANSPLTFTNIPANAPVVVDGTDNTGTQVLELVTGAGPTAVTTTHSYSKVSILALGGAGTASITVTGKALSLLAASYPTLQNAATYVNSLQQSSGSGTPAGFSMTVTGAQTLPLASIDAFVTTDAAQSGGVSFTADAFAIANWINGNSQLVTATLAPNATGAPTAAVSPTYLVGGSENVATQTDYQNCLNLLKHVRVNSVVALTSDPSINAAVDAHCAYMCGIGRSERDAFIGIQNPTLDNVATLAQIQAQTLALNSKNIRACPQFVTLYNSKRVAQEYPPHFAAVIAAGMQAGSKVGTSLTYKQPRVLGYRQDSSWNPLDDTDALINAGALIMQQVDGKGIRWVRNITTYQTDTNIAFQNAEVNEALNYAVYTFRNDLEFAVGQPGFSGTLNQFLTKAKQSLLNLIAAGALTAYDSLTASIVADAYQASVQMYPTVGTNFVKISVFASNQTIALAA